MSARQRTDFADYVVESRPRRFIRSNFQLLVVVRGHGFADDVVVNLFGFLRLGGDGFLRRLDWLGRRDDCCWQFGSWNRCRLHFKCRLLDRHRMSWRRDHWVRKDNRFGVNFRRRHDRRHILGHNILILILLRRFPENRVLNRLKRGGLGCRDLAWRVSLLWLWEGLRRAGHNPSLHALTSLLLGTLDEVIQYRCHQPSDTNFKDRNEQFRIVIGPLHERGGQSSGRAHKISQPGHDHVVHY